MPPADAMAAANREVTTRVLRLKLLAKIVCVGAGILIACAVFYFIASSMFGNGVGRRHGGGRAGAAMLMIGVAAGFVVPFLGLRALFRWLLVSRTAAWVAALAAQHGLDRERLQKMAEATRDLA